MIDSILQKEDSDQLVDPNKLLTNHEQISALNQRFTEYLKKRDVEYALTTKKD